MRPKPPTLQPPTTLHESPIPPPCKRKSAALGLAIAGALGLGYANIFVTAPSPENLRTLFEFVFKGLDALGYQEHIDYDLVESTNPAFGRAVVRVNVYRNHRQTVQYIQPQHHSRLAQAELLVIDEAAAIPLPLVKAMLGPYLVFLCSTVNGYEGTGRSLSLKLIQQLREQAAKPGAAGGGGGGSSSGGGGGAGLGRTFREVTLSEPIRYAPGDPVESWLHSLLCLDASTHLPRPPPKLPHPSECDLFYVERDTLFSFHKASEAFLQQVVSLLVASHYKNTPNDLLLLADAPAHQLYVLLAPVDETQNALPDVLAVAQVALEGAISAKAATTSLARGELPQGDLIPWIVGQQYQDPDFPRLSGARVVRIAVHPELSGAGYGSRCVELLRRYFQGEITGLDEEDEEAAEDGHANGSGGSASERRRAAAAADGGDTLLTESVKPRLGLPPLLVNLAERRPERLHYLGVSFGLTQQLFNFWHRGGFKPLYLRQSASETTGEHTAVMVRPLEHPEVEGTAWLDPFVQDFKRRLMMLLGGAFRDMSPALALSLLDPRLTWSDAEGSAAAAAAGAGPGSGVVAVHGDGTPFTPYDLKRLQAYSSNLVDFHLVLDLLPPLAATYLAGRLPATLSYGQAAILLALGLQRRELSEVLALFNKAVRKLHSHIRAAKEAAISRHLPKPSAAPALAPLGAARGGGADLDAELDEAGEEASRKLRALLDPAELQQYAVTGADEDFARALGGAAPGAGGVVQVKSSSGAKKAGGKDGKDGGKDGAQLYKKGGGKKQKGTPGGGGKPAKKHKKG
ncbi:putative N-acetyltransferase 10 [Monoraphidium neglectum]|uniref:RNA cytidine acetyltransferase n=1 Tax=Monoraphidium neglectum TaxID=145388 RepID=A0A0D2M1L1_9CHLO|nr:putative N-acetyltransferase 10 [Monoraphidium neglectum]KIY97539.1 putative N-acetyltransferase 10 [Monoraphidium neglectum]|eukprot:XP_013896559.1 putative N-acetyltransferase 10 [Monoraphidium neglectum]